MAIYTMTKMAYEVLAITKDRLVPYTAKGKNELMDAHMKQYARENEWAEDDDFEVERIEYYDWLIKQRKHTGTHLSREKVLEHINATFGLCVDITDICIIDS